MYICYTVACSCIIIHNSCRPHIRKHRIVGAISAVPPGEPYPSLNSHCIMSLYYYPCVVLFSSNHARGVSIFTHINLKYYQHPSPFSWRVEVALVLTRLRPFVTCRSIAPKSCGHCCQSAQTDKLEWSSMMSCIR